MSDSEEKDIIRHIRGATVIHKSPFGCIEVPSKDDVISIEDAEKYVDPFYRVSFRGVDGGFLVSLRAIYPQLTPQIVESLLTEYDWRPRLTGAFFAALRNFGALEDQIGRLLLRSDLCFAGKLYCVALAEFNTPCGLGYLTRYLEYYLTRPDLDYDQGDAMGAIAYLDSINGTNHFDRLRPLWDNYIQAKDWRPDLESDVRWFADEMSAIHACRKYAEPKP